MAKRRTKRGVGTFLRIPLEDGEFGYARLLDGPYEAFYRYASRVPVPDLDAIRTSPVAFILTVDQASADEWDAVGQLDLEPALRAPVVRFRQDIGDYRNCTIYDTAGAVRQATPDECEGIERSASWNGDTARQRLIDELAGRPNATVERLRVRRS